MGAEFPAARIATTGPGRRRVGLIAAVAVVVVAAAVSKPWEAQRPATVAIGPVVAQAPTQAPTTGAEEALPWNLPNMPPADVAQAIRPHRSWGLRAIVWDTSSFDELWLAAPPPGDAPGEPDPERLVLDPAGRAVMLLGVTLAPGSSPVVGVRAYRLAAPGRYARVPVQLAGLTTIDQAVVLVARTDGDAWAPGVYRLRALLRNDQATLAFEIAAAR